MKTEIEIVKEKIEEYNNTIKELEDLRMDMMKTLCVLYQSDFEKKFGVKSGDKIKTQAGADFFYKCCDIDYAGNYVVVCNMVKMDGTASLKTKTLPFFKFGVRI